MRRLMHVMLACAMALALPALAFAQATGSITGVVTDESGAVMPGIRPAA